MTWNWSEWVQLQALPVNPFTTLDMFTQKMLMEYLLRSWCAVRLGVRVKQTVKAKELCELGSQVTHYLITKVTKRGKAGAAVYLEWARGTFASVNFFLHKKLKINK